MKAELDIDFATISFLSNQSVLGTCPKICAYIVLHFAENNVATKILCERMKKMGFFK